MKKISPMSLNGSMGSEKRAINFKKILTRIITRGIIYNIRGITDEKLFFKGSYQDT